MPLFISKICLLATLPVPDEEDLIVDVVFVDSVNREMWAGRWERGERGES
jgi:hypothetical protein